MTADLAVPNLESTDMETDSTTGKSNVSDLATVSSKEERKRNLTRERVRRFRARHKKRGPVESSKPRKTNIRDTSTTRTAGHTTPDQDNLNIVVAVTLIVFTVVIVTIVMINRHDDQSTVTCNDLTPTR